MRREGLTPEYNVAWSVLWQTIGPQVSTKLEPFSVKSQFPSKSRLMSLEHDALGFRTCRRRQSQSNLLCAGLARAEVAILGAFIRATGAVLRQVALVHGCLANLGGHDLLAARREGLSA